MAQERSEWSEAVKTDGQLKFWDEYSSIPTTFEEFFAEEPCPGAYTSETSSSGMSDLFEKGEGEPIQAATPMEGFPVYGRIRTFAQKLSWSFELYNDIQVADLFMRAVASWADALARTKDRYFARFFNNGALLTGDSVFNATIPGVVQDPSGNLCYDMRPMFTDVSRPRLNRAGMPYYNHIISNDLSAESLQAAYVQMTTVNNRDEKGDEIILEPDILLVPKALEFKAEELLRYAQQHPNTADFLLNTTKVNAALANRLRVVAWPRLTDDDAWFLVSSKRGLVNLTRGTEQIDFWIDNETKNWCASIVARWGGYCRNWRYQFGSNCRTA